MEKNNLPEQSNSKKTSNNRSEIKDYEENTPGLEFADREEQIRKTLNKKWAMPVYIPENLDPGPAILDKIGPKEIGTIIGDTKNVKLITCKNPQENASFGFIDVFARVESKEEIVRSTLVLKFDPGKLAMVAPRSLRLFRFNPEKEGYELIVRSGLGRHGNYVWGQIHQAGSFAVIGINTDPLVQNTLHMLGSIKEVTALADPTVSKLIRDRLCLVILCSSEFKELVANVEFIEKLDFIGSAKGYPMPRNSAGLLPGGGGLGNLCNFCLGLPGNPPELDIPLIPFPNPVCYSTNWESIGPINLSGMVLDIALNPSSSDVLYVAALHSGAWRLNEVSDYPATSWVPISESILPNYLRKLSVFNLDQNVIYAFASEPDQLPYLLYKTTNGGRIWHEITITGAGYYHQIAVHPTNPEIVYVASQNGLFYSDDGGVGWNQIHDNNIMDIAIDPEDASIIYIISRNKVFKTFSGGLGADAWELLFEADLDHSVYSAKIALGNNNADGSRQTDSNRTVVYMSKERIYLNQHGGRNIGEGWQFKGALAFNEPLDEFETAELALDINPFDPNIILAGFDVLFRTSDGGDHWSAIETFHHHEFNRYRAVIFDRNTSGLGYLATETGVFRSIDSGITWYVEGFSRDEEIAAGRNLNLNLVTADMSAAIQNDMAMGLFWGKVYSCANITSGNWDQSDHDGPYINNIHADPKRIGRYYVQIERRQWMIIYPGDFRFYGDFGSAAPSDNMAMAVDERRGSNIILSGTREVIPEGSILITREGNKLPFLNPAGTWENLPEWEESLDLPSSYIIAIAFSKKTPGKAYAISWNHDVYRKNNVDDSRSWETLPKLPGSTALYHLAISVVGGRECLYVSGYRTVKRSLNEGRTWLEIAPNLDNDSHYWFLVPHPIDNEILYLGASNGIYISYDSGDHWSPFDMNLPKVRIRKMQYDNGYLYVCTRGRGIWRKRIC